MSLNQNVSSLNLILPSRVISFRLSNFNISHVFLNVPVLCCHLHAPIVLKSGSLNLLEPSGPVKACNGIVLPFTLCYAVLGSLVFLHLAALT
jgi:hypothetical protein